MSEHSNNNTNGAHVRRITEHDRASINRANAQLSTGPRTDAGKRRSSLNALRHGLTSQAVVLPSEDLAAYRRHIDSFLNEYKPQSATERHYVHTLADTAWRMNRIVILENNLLALGLIENADKINTADPEIHSALTMATSLDDQTRALATLSLHESRLSRQFFNALRHLREIQAERERTEKEKLQRAARLLQFHKRTEKGRPYNPSSDGFVFSTDKIEDFIQRSKRHDRALNAAWNAS